MGSFLSANAICRVSQSEPTRIRDLVAFFPQISTDPYKHGCALCAERSSSARVIGRKIAYFTIGAAVIHKYANAITAFVGARLFYEVEKPMNALSWEMPLLQFECKHGDERYFHLRNRSNYMHFTLNFFSIYFNIRSL